MFSQHVSFCHRGRGVLPRRLPEGRGVSYLGSFRREGGLLSALLGGGRGGGGSASDQTTPPPDNYCHPHSLIWMTLLYNFTLFLYWKNCLYLFSKKKFQPHFVQNKCHLNFFYLTMPRVCAMYMLLHNIGSACVYRVRVPTDQGKFWQLFPVREIREKHVLSQNQGNKFQIREILKQYVDT